jgi:nucleotide-binding universal stress UspA family protein
MLPVKTIVCPTDFSGPSYRGIEVANELAVHFSANLILISVVTPIHPIGAPGIPASFKIGEYYEEMIDFATQSLEEIEAEKISPGVKTQRVVAQGNAADEIVRRAESEHADIIVIATHGWTGWRRWVFGSVAERVVRLAKCPVVTIPKPNEEA